MTTQVGRQLRRATAALACGLGLIASWACGSTSSNEVVLRLIAYKPDQLEVNRGTTVRWKHEDAGFHTVTSGTVQQEATGVETDPDGTFDSGRLRRGEEFTFAFGERGAYLYFCRIHPATMQGRVTVD